jgi:hypothetical protein
VARTLVSYGVETLTLTLPSVSAGVTAVSDVPEFTVKLGASTAPNFTSVAPVKRFPF